MLLVGSGFVYRIEEQDRKHCLALFVVASLGLLFGGLTSETMYSVLRDLAGTASAVLGVLQYAAASLSGLVIGWLQAKTLMPIAAVLSSLTMVSVLLWFLGSRTAKSDDLTGHACEMEKSRSPELCEVKWLRRCDGKLPKTQQVQKLVDKLETEHANNAEKLSDGHMALLTQLLTLSEAAFKRQSIDVFNSQSQRSKQFLWIASLVIAAAFALLNLSLTFLKIQLSKASQKAPSLWT